MKKGRFGFVAKASHKNQEQIRPKHTVTYLIKQINKSNCFVHSLKFQSPFSFLSNKKLSCQNSDAGAPLVVVLRIHQPRVSC